MSARVKAAKEYFKCPSYESAWRNDMERIHRLLSKASVPDDRHRPVIAEAKKKAFAMFARCCEVFIQTESRNTRYLSSRPARAYVMSSPEDLIILGLTLENWLLLAGLTSIVAIAVLSSKL
jgi:hypothetical protein